MSSGSNSSSGKDAPIFVPFGATILRHEVVASTQDIARSLVLSSPTDSTGTVVTATCQTQGRGRRGRVWYAPRGANVCMTVIAPAVPFSRVWETALVAGVAVAEGILSATGGAAKPRLRFPNDVLLNGKKAAGVLVETAPVAGDARRAVPLIGIGVNVRDADLPPEVSAIATSLERATGNGYAVTEVETAVLERLTVNWQAWEQGATWERWRAFADPILRRNFIFDGRTVPCRVVDMDAEGTVTLETPEGEMRRLHASQVILGED